MAGSRRGPRDEAPRRKGMTRYAVVTVPVADLRRRPVEAEPLNIHDDLEESQVLFHESLIVREETARWYRVEAPEQPRFAGPEGWQGYPGWVRKKDAAEMENPVPHDGVVKSAFALVRPKPVDAGPPLFPVSLGPRLSIKGEAKGFFEIGLEGEKTGWVAKKEIARKPEALPRAGLSGDLVRAARLFLGAAYLWGGRSMPLPWSRGPVMGVDCSGLTNLVFRACHMDIPRDAHDQWAKAAAIAPEELGPGDLIFLSREGQADAINHVMLSLGSDRFIEAQQTGDVVRIRSFRERFGLDLEGLGQAAFTVQKRKLCFGRITP